MSPSPRYVAAFVESFPTPMEPSVLYVSQTYATAGHICPCGCGREVVTKLSRARYRIIYDGEISLEPSVAATGLPCNSHYFITRGQVDWRSQLTDRQAQRARTSDHAAVDRLRSTESPPRLLARWWRSLRHWS